jgi:hypothetical protein
MSVFGQQVMEQFSGDRSFDEFEEFDPLANVNDRGHIDIGQTVRGAVSPITGDKWAFSGQAEDVLLLHITPFDDFSDWELYVFNPEGALLANTMDSDAGYVDYSRIEIALASDSVYTVVVRAAFFGGEYELSLHYL